MPGVVYVGLGGFVGASLRYLLSLTVVRMTAGAAIPYGTLACNVIGCLLIGCIAGFDEARSVLTHELRLFLLVGVLGGFTTFSTFGLEAVELGRQGVPLLVLTHVSLHVVTGLSAVFAGLAAGRALAG